MVVINLVIGLGIFLYGMSQLERGIHKLSARKFKRWLMNHTHTALSSAIFGTFATAILQSSSMVSLLVLAFASANIIPLYNGLGIMLGANLGTTFTGWIVTLVGFKLNLKNIALPLIALAGLIKTTLPNKERIKGFTLCLLGLGLLIFGLNFMKESVASLPHQWDMALLQDQPLWLYLIFGIVMTAIIQSSSATMLISLASLNVHLIQLPEAAAVIIGADLGTTSTTILGCISGSAIKKRLAFGHCFFNIITAIIAFYLLLPWLFPLLSRLNISDPLYGLVAFHSLFNFIGLLLFLPFLKLYTRWIQKLFIQPSQSQLSLSTEVPEAALQGLINAVQQLYIKAIFLNCRNLKQNIDGLDLKHCPPDIIDATPQKSSSFEQSYESIKALEDEILHVSLNLQKQPLSPSLTLKLNQLLEIVRGIIYSCKTLKDVREDLVMLRHESSKPAQQLYSTHCRYHVKLYNQLLSYIFKSHPSGYLQESITEILDKNDKHYAYSNEKIYLSPFRQEENQLFNSSALNINREIHHAAKNLLMTIPIWGHLIEESQ